MRIFSVLAVVLLFAGAVLGETIYEVQFNDSDPGSGDDCYPSPYFEDEVTITGVVTAVLTGDYPDFWLQEKGNPLWAGVFIYDITVEPSAGDSLTLTAEVDEYFGLTEIKNVSDFEIHGSADLPGITDITTEDLAGGCVVSGEQYEGMLVRVTDVECTQEPNQYGEWYIEDASGVECQVDDYIYQYEATVGEQFPAIIGIVHYGYGEFKLLPRSLDDLSVQEGSVQPVRSSYALLGASPNPARGLTEIAYEMAHPGLVSLKVFDASGRLVTDLFHGHAGEGIQTCAWNTGALDAGVYFISMEAEGFEATRPLVIAR
jgi:hypothetical protein